MKKNCLLVPLSCLFLCGSAASSGGAGEISWLTHYDADHLGRISLPLGGIGTGTVGLGGRGEVEVAEGALPPGMKFVASGGVAHSPGPGGADLLTLSNRHGEVEVSLYGAQIRRYDPAGQKPVLFAPGVPAAFEKGGTMFGGIPYAWPWFNMNGEAHTAQHGFAFRSKWKVLDATGSDDVTEVRLLLESSQETKKEWPYDFRIVYTIRLSDRLELDFSTENTGTAAFSVTEGFHPYFNVAETTNTVVRGLHGVVEDKIDPDKPNPVHRGALACSPGMNAVFFAPPGAVEIADAGNARSIFVWGRENRKIIVWNPGPNCGIPELGPDDWRHMICVEPANIQRECATRILPGRVHELRATVKSVPHH